MNWINLRTETLRSGDFANARPGAIETWLRVLAYCCEQENGGQLSKACEWTDRGWMTTCGVTKAEIENAYPLVYDDAVDVFVAAFPTEKQAEVQAKRKGGKRGGRRSASSRASSTPSNSASTEGEGEGERKENRNEKENRNVNGAKTRGTRDELRSFCKEIELPESDGDSCFDKWEGNGWKNGGQAIKCWRSTIRAWKTNGYLPSQKNGPTRRTEAQRDRENTGLKSEINLRKL